MNRLISVSANGTVQAAYTYDQNGNRQSVVYSNGLTTTYTYNNANLIINLKNKIGSETLSEYTYSYRLDGNQVSKTDHTGTVTDYSYDDLGRLTSEAIQEYGAIFTSPTLEGMPHKISYMYDNANNRSATTVSYFYYVDATWASVSRDTTTYTYNDNNQLVTETLEPAAGVSIITSYNYDANGNQISKTRGNKTTEYTFDVFNRLRGIVTNGHAVYHRYKADGLRLSINTQSEEDSQTIVHIWDGGNIAAEFDGIANLLSKYIRGVNLIKFIHPTDSNADKYYIYNGHGDVVQLANNSGDITKNYTYSAFCVETGADTTDENT
jgi:YD repeat-containing protein